jgi:hypothetical protein
MKQLEVEAVGAWRSSVSDAARALPVVDATTEARSDWT